MYPHRIRLGPPWTSEPAGAGTTRRRRFGAPRRLDAHERLWLVLTGPGGDAGVSVNGEPLGPVPPGGAAFDITGSLRTRNEAVVATSGASELGEVFLEVRGPVWLTGLRAAVSGRGLTVSGAVVAVPGFADPAAGGPGGELEVYAVADRRTLAYDTISPSAGQSPFRLTAPAEPPPGRVRVDLVQGAVTWYGEEIPVTRDGE